MYQVKFNLKEYAELVTNQPDQHKLIEKCIKDGLLHDLCKPDMWCKLCKKYNTFQLRDSSIYKDKFSWKCQTRSCSYALTVRKGPLGCHHKIPLDQLIRFIIYYYLPATSHEVIS